ncbi:E3 ubiquitin-protein ligase RBBP6-like protein [Columba guinea]|nr:E3 ubiquitin-protein ligase RBBP6-like protein [Columba guinea]
MGTSRVYYKFFAALDYEAVTFNGLHISLHELKCKIRARKKLKATKCDLLVTNAQTKEGIRTALLESEEHTCPVCHQTDVSPDSLVANKILRQAVNNFRNGTGYSKQIQQQQQLPPAPVGQPVTRNPQPLLRPTISKQKDPLIPPSASVSSHSAALSSFGPTQASGAAQLPGILPSVTVPGVPPAVSLLFPGPFREKKKSKLDEFTNDFAKELMEYKRIQKEHRQLLSRGQSHTKRTVPQGEGEREYFNRHAEGPASSMKGYYGRSVDVRDPFEKERCREWERNYREWYGKVYKGCAVAAQPPPAVNRENFSPERFGPPGSRQENSACAWGNREDYPGGQSHRCHNITGHDGEEPSGREGPGISDPRKSKEKEVKYPWGDDKGNEQKRHQKRRKCNENEGFCSAELLEGARTPREPVPAGDDKTDSLFVLPSRGDATPVRDEPMEADWIAFKPGSGEERTEKDKPKEKNDQTKSKVEVAAPPKKDDTIIAAQSSQETVDTDCENSPQMEPPAKKVKKELSKTDDAVVSSSQKDEKAPGAPWKYHPKVTKGHPGTRTAKDEKVKKDHPKETKSEKPSREDKSEKPAEKSKTSDAKPEKGKGNADEKVDEEHEATCTDASKPETAEWKPSAKGKSEPDAGKGERTPETAKCAFLNRPAKEIELQQETGENLVRGENVPPAEDPAGKPKASSSKVKQDKAEGKARIRVTAADGSSSVLVGYTSSSSTEGRPRTKTEEKPDTNQTVIKTMEEYSNDLRAPAEDVILTIQVSQSKWDKDEFEAKEEHSESTQVPTNVGKLASVIKNVSAKPPNPVKHNGKEMEPLEEIQKSTKEVNGESSQHDAKSSKGLISNEKGKNKDRDHSLSDQDTSGKSSVQRETDHSECATEQGHGRNSSQSSQDSRSSEKHGISPSSTAKDCGPNQVKKSDHNGNKDRSSSKCRAEKSEFVRIKDSPSGNRGSTSVRKSEPRDEPAEPSETGTGDAKMSRYSPPRQWEQSDHKAAPDYKCTLEQHKPLAKNPGKEKEKHVSEVKSKKEKEPGGNTPPLGQESLDVKNENVTGQNDPSVVKPKPQVSSSSHLSGVTSEDITQDTDEAAFVPDYNESDSESSGPAADEKAAGKNPKDLLEKAIDKVKEDPAAAAAVGQPEGSRGHSQSSPGVGHSRSQSPSERQTQSHSSNAGSGQGPDTKKRKKEKKKKRKKKKKHKKQKEHKKQKKHTESKMELEKSLKHKDKKKKLKKGKDKDDQKGKSATM